jgi:hypothetical protein
LPSFCSSKLLEIGNRMGKNLNTGYRNNDRENFSAFNREPQKRKVRGHRRKHTNAEIIADSLSVEDEVMFPDPVSGEGEQHGAD